MSDALAVQPETGLLAVVETNSGEKVSLCYQCRKCTNGCPLSFAMDLMPNQVMHAVELGLEDEVLKSATVWVCASCQTCTTRCPNDIDIAHVMDTLRRLSREKGVAAEPNVVKFHEAFLDSVRRHGRVFELGMVGRYKLASRDLFSDTKMALEMLKRGKLKFLPEGVKDKKEIRRIFDEK